MPTHPQVVSPSTGRVPDINVVSALADGARASRSGRSPDGRSACEIIDEDWPIGAADVPESQLKAEADRVAGRAFSPEDIRVHYGLPHDACVVLVVRFVQRVWGVA
jgi:hypothetical protein